MIGTKEQVELEGPSLRAVEPATGGDRKGWTLLLVAAILAAGVAVALFVARTSVMPRVHVGPAAVQIANRADRLAELRKGPAPVQIANRADRLRATGG
jgi:hypothetical protein